MTYDELADYCKEASNEIIRQDEEIRKLEKENQELKKQLDKYENPEDMTLMMMWCTEKVKDENEKLKKQLHEASLTIQEMTEQDIECPSNCEKLRQLKKQVEENTETLLGRILELRGQQKEFIKYLEEEIKIYSKTTYAEEILKELEEILKEYKKIVGVSDDNKTTI